MSKIIYLLSLFANSYFFHFIFYYDIYYLSPVKIDKVGFLSIKRLIINIFRFVIIVFIWINTQ